MLDLLRRRREHARRRLARLTQAAALGGVSLALLAPPASGAVAPTPQASGDDDDPRDARTGERPRMDRPLDRPVRAATPQAETVLAGLRQAQASGGITPSFGAGVDNPFGLTDIGLNVKMAIGDLDGDGDLDVIATSSQSTELFFYENTPQPDGTPSFSRSTNPFGLSGVTFNADNSQPTLGDLDGDGDMDILVGQYYSAGFLYFENTPGTDGVPSFTSVVENPFGLTATPGYSGLDVGQTGAIVDLDGDG
ncbi:MAG: FG-GAP-like repeat-containing protein, partial [Bacteroidota bacterium]